METLRTVVAVAFTLLAFVCVWLWMRWRSRPAAWLATAFSTLAGGVLLGRLYPVLPSDAVALLERVVRAAIVAFPYLLFRFTASLRPPARGVRYAAGVAAAAIVGASLLLPTPDGPQPAWYTAYVFAALGVWTVLSTWVVWRFWHAGASQPIVARRRMRTLSVAAAVLNLALLIAAASGAAGVPTWVTPAVQFVALGSAMLFYLGFAAPPALRSVWRRAEERALWRAESSLITSMTADDVISRMLPHVSHLLGGGPAVFVDRDGGERAYGTVPPQLRTALLSTGDGVMTVGDDVLVTLELRSGRLGVAATPFTPMFGSDEVELARWLGTLMDLALGRVELHERERVARARAEEVSKELEALVYGITHDLRNPIVAVLGYVECLAEDYGQRLDGQGLHFLSRLRTNAEYMDRLIADLLALSRVGRVPEAVEAVDLSSVTTGVVDELRSAYPDATLVVDVLPEVMMSPSRARQLMTNLISNALVHSGRSDVTIEICSPPVPLAAGQACIAVIDDGRGIPEQHRDKVFGLFERLEHGDKEANGTGIGLAMCQRIVARAGGRIWVADGDVGTDVRVELPLAVHVPEGREGSR